MRFASHAGPSPVAVALAVVLALLFAGHGAVALAATQPYGGETPQAVVERMKAAAETEDLGEMAACLAPSDRATLSLTMVMMTGMVMAFASMGGEMAGGMMDAMSDEEMSAEQQAEMEAKKAEAKAVAEKMASDYETILAKHGLKDLMADDTPLDPEADPAEVLKGVDQVALLQDLFGFLESLPDNDEGEEEGEDEHAGPMDMPHGDLSALAVDGDHATGKLGDEDVEFVRIDGRWYVSLDLMEKMRAGGGEMMEGDMEMDEGEMDADSMDDGGMESDDGSMDEGMDDEEMEDDGGIDGGGTNATVSENVLLDANFGGG